MEEGGLKLTARRDEDYHKEGQRMTARCGGG